METKRKSYTTEEHCFVKKIYSFEKRPNVIQKYLKYYYNRTYTFSRHPNLDIYKKQFNIYKEKYKNSIKKSLSMSNIGTIEYKHHFSSPKDKVRYKFRDVINEISADRREKKKLKREEKYELRILKYEEERKQKQIEEIEDNKKRYKKYQYIINLLPEKYKYLKDPKTLKRTLLKTKDKKLRKLCAYIYFFNLRSRKYVYTSKMTITLVSRYSIQAISTLFVKSKFDELDFKPIKLNLDKENFDKIVNIANIHNSIFGSYLESLFCHMVDPTYVIYNRKHWYYASDFKPLIKKLKFIYRSKNPKYMLDLPKYVLTIKQSPIKDKILKFIKENNLSEFLLNHLSDLLKIIPYTNKKVYINLKINGGWVDMIIGDTIYEIKCYKGTSNRCIKTGFIQSLLYVIDMIPVNYHGHNDTYGTVNLQKINKICIINLLKKEYYEVDISDITDVQRNLLRYGIYNYLEYYWYNR